MQPLTAPPREHLTEAQVRDLLTGPDLDVEKEGLELLDETNQVVEDISDDLVSGGSVSWDNRQALHGSVRLSLQRQLSWGRARIRPYMVLANAAVSARFNLGVYVLATPDTKRGETPITYDVTGYDLLSLLQTGPADTWVAVAGTTYFEACRDILDAAGIGAPLLIDGTLQDTEIPATRVWALASPVPSWLRMLTDLLAEIGYVPPWMDENGSIRSKPFQDVAVRPVEWTIDIADAKTNLAHDDRTLTIEGQDIANWWRFVRSNMDTTPEEGDGIYTVENLDDGATSQEALGRVVTKYVPLEAADQATLVAQGDKIVAGDMAAVRKVDLLIDPLPIMGTDDVFQYTDSGETEKVAAASWTLNLDGSPGQLQLGGAPAEPLAVIEAQTKATVTSAAPLRVVVDGATVASFANALDAATYSIGDRVTVTVRNPLPPLVAGVES